MALRQSVIAFRPEQEPTVLALLEMDEPGWSAAGHALGVSAFPERRVAAEPGPLNVETGFLSGGGAMGTLIRAHDWSASPLGVPEGWAQPLKTLVGVMLTSNQPMFVAWGPSRALLYNDMYAEILGRKHPGALGQPFHQVWSEIWDEIEPIMARCYAGEPIQMDDILLVMHRHGRPEETHFTFSYTPVRDEAGLVAGLFCPCLEITAKVLADRRQAFRLGLEDRLRNLSNPREAMATAAEALGILLGAGQVAYADIEEAGEYSVIERDWNDGSIPSNAGRHRLNEFGSGIVASLKRGKTVIVGDVRRDRRTSEPDALAAFDRVSVRAFLNVPLVKSGQLVAILTVHGSAPRDWSSADIGLTEEVAERTWQAVERARAEAALRASEARWRGLFERMHEGFALCEIVYGAGGTAVDFRYLEVNAAWERLTGLPAAQVLGRLATEAIPGIEEFWIRTYANVAATGEPAHFEYRLAALGRWFEVLAYRADPGRFAALFLNITDRKAAAERQALLAREVDHRAKNALAVVQAALRLTRAADLPSYMRAIEGRVGALARAQTLLADDRWSGADLRTLLQGEMAAFLDGGAGGPTAVLMGPLVALPPGAAQPLAMAVHELATNALKHGALSTPTGRVEIFWSLEGGPEGRLRLRWVETGGPFVAGPPKRRGFGSRVLEGTVQGQLGGTVAVAWEAAGLICDIEAPLARTNPPTVATGIGTTAEE